MRTFRFLQSLALLVMLAMPTASAYTSTGTDPSAEAPALYVHRNSDDAAYWLSNVADEPDANDPDPGYNVLGIAPLGAAGLGCGDAAQYCWQIAMDPAPTADIELDPSLPTRFHLIYQTIVSAPVAGGPGGGPGYGSISATLLVDGQAVASVEGAAAPTTGEFETVDLESDTGIAVIPAGADVVLDIRFDGISGGAVLGADGTHEGNTHVLLPILAAAPAGPVLHFDALQAASVEQRFANATSDTYILNFTNDLENVTAAFAWEATNGSVQAVLNGADGRVFEATFTGNGSQEEILEGVEPGAWNLTLQYANFTGTFAFSLDVYQPEPEDEGPNTSTTTSTASPTGGDQDGSGQDGNATGNQTLDGGGDQESPALPLVLGGLMVLAMARFRRR